MAGYLLKRLLQSAILFWIVTVITFVIIRQAPGGPAILANPDLSKKQIETLTVVLGLADPLYVQYGRWIGNVMRGDLGTSFNEGVPVWSLITERLPNTLLLSSVALVIAITLGMGLGILSAVKRNSWLDTFASTLGVLNLSIPAFWLGIVLILLFAVELKWLPVGGMPRARDWSLLELARHLVLPSVVAGGFLMANVMRFTRSSMLEVSDQLYVTAARAMGIREHRVLLVYALKNAMLPVVTVIGLGLPQLFAGAAITETVFAWPGIGSLGIAAARSGDFPLIMGITLVVSFVVIVANLLTDLSYMLLDPRVKFS
jgi:peptide/nickel transport system permease protein